MKYEFINNAIFNIDDVKKYFNSDQAMYSALKRLIDNGTIEKLKSGLYATINPITQGIYVNRFEIATALHNNSYVAYHSAIEYYGLANQAYYDVHMITPVQYSPVIIEGLEYQSFISKYDFGVIDTFNNAPIRITDLERTVLDAIDRIDVAGGIEEVYSALGIVSYLNEERLLRYLEFFNKKLLYKKAGYFFSRLKPSYLSEDFYKECKRHISHRRDDICQNKRFEKYEYSKEWELYAPLHILNEWGLKLLQNLCC